MPLHAASSSPLSQATSSALSPIAAEATSRAVTTVQFYVGISDVQIDVRKALRATSADDLHTWAQQNSASREGVTALLARRSLANTRSLIDPVMEAQRVPYAPGLMAAMAIGGLQAVGLYSDALADAACADRLRERFVKGVQQLDGALTFDSVSRTGWGEPMLACMAMSRIQGDFLAPFAAESDVAYYKKMLLPAMGVFCAKTGTAQFESALQTFGAVNLYARKDLRLSPLERVCTQMARQLRGEPDIVRAYARVQAAAADSILVQSASERSKATGKRKAPLSNSPLLQLSQSASSDAARVSLGLALSDGPAAAHVALPADVTPVPLLRLCGPQGEALLTATQIFHATRRLSELTPVEREFQETVQFCGAEISLSRLDLRVLLGMDAAQDDLPSH